ncbi:uncharacterized protein LOC132262046 [Phlebotomus argentipes]|uniref:uncharacterized protein LOC132262046 n=1 Tax=Phlebotomus argentipes TaxID=94469 RepID=UPI002892FD02|nr:uncharacterized protein LOC132262046 [Phlebotomus argentipes]
MSSDSSVMKSLVCFLLVAFGALALSWAESGALSAKIQVVEDVGDFLSANPEAVLAKLTPLRTPRAILYTLGSRVPKDRLVANARDSTSWATPQNVQLVLNYPTNGVGANVSYVSVLVNQTSNLGAAYVLSGGIGQRQVSLLVEAKNTYTFGYLAEIYGF